MPSRRAGPNARRRRPRRRRKLDQLSGLGIGATLGCKPCGLDEQQPPGLHQVGDDRRLAAASITSASSPPERRQSSTRVASPWRISTSRSCSRRLSASRTWPCSPRDPRRAHAGWATDRRGGTAGEDRPAQALEDLVGNRDAGDRRGHASSVSVFGTLAMVTVPRASTRHTVRMVNRRPELKLIAPSASPEEAAAVVAALERFIAIRTS